VASGSTLCGTTGTTASTFRVTGNINVIIAMTAMKSAGMIIAGTRTTIATATVMAEIAES